MRLRLQKYTKTGDTHVGLSLASLFAGQRSTEQVYPDPYAPQRWTLSSVRDHAIATPAAAAVREAVIRAR